MPSARVRVLVAALLLVLGYSLCLALRVGFADVYAAPAKAYLHAKRDAGRALTRDEWQVIHDTLARALALSPDDPESLSELGRLYRTLLEAKGLDADQILQYGNGSAFYYQAALALRPTWPWDWADLALVKYQQYQDSSSAYQAALVQVVEFGPRESSLQDRVVDLGSHSWAALGPAAARAVLTAADRALERDARWFSGMSDAKDQWRPLCAHASESYEHLMRRCLALGLT
jgi:hypothetical protein